MKNLKIDDIKENYYRITFEINWDVEWYKVSQHVFSYKHMNILMVDLDIFIRGLDILKRGGNGISGLFQKVN